MTYSRQDLASYENLELAWKRIQTSTSHEYKRLNEDIYTAFGWNLEENIKCFSREIAERIYQPIRASKYYLPKKSNLVRPISALSIKDQICYQAIVNLICNHKLDDIRQFRHTNVFGGVNFFDPDSIFFLSDWRQEYDLYKSAIKKAFEADYKWLCRFDLASFYDVIDHKILIEVSADGALDDDLRRVFFECLQIWTQPQTISFSHSHGIPQGPVASQVLADIYLHFLDQKLTRLCFKNDLRYFRYVDDIVLMSKSEKQAQASLIKLDITARELALIPQSGKISIKEVENIQDELKGENSLFDVLESLTQEETFLEQQERLLALLLASVEKVGKKLRIVDETIVKYSLNRLAPHHKVSSLAVEIIKLYPHLTDPCISYLRRCRLDQVLSQSILEHIKEEPIFDWHTARLLCISFCLEQDKLQELISLSAQWILDLHKHWFLRREAVQLSKALPGFYGLMIEEFENAVIKGSFISELPYFITLLRLSLELNFDSTISQIESLRNSHFLPDDFYIFIGYYSALSMQALPSRLEEYSWVSNNLLIDNKDRSIDGISYNLVDFYKLADDLKSKIDFRDYLEAEEYQAALEHLCKARGFFEKEPDLYFAHTDSFNQILLACIHSRNGVDISRFKFELSNMIGKLKPEIPHAFSGLDKCHTLREEVPSIHAYSQTKNCLNKSSSTRFRERDSLKGMLAGSYEAILIYIAEKHIMSLVQPYSRIP